MTSFKVLMTPEARANFIVQFLLDERTENQEFAKEQILALCEFYEDNKPDEEEGASTRMEEADNKAELELVDPDPRETHEEHYPEEPGLQEKLDKLGEVLGPMISEDLKEPEEEQA